MNKVYQIVWNSSLACMQVVSELVTRHVSSGGASAVVNRVAQGVAVFNLALLPMAVFAAVNPNALPQGAQIIQGQGQIQQQGNVLTVKQNSQHLNTKWDSFNVGQNATVNFQQPNRSSVAVNQVLDRNASHIMGRLNANGQVFLLNPNGVIFSKSAQVNVGGLVASTLNQAKHDEANGRFTLSGQANSQASVENHGHIIANGGTVALIAPNVINTGRITTPNGVTHLTSANQVTLALQDGSLTQYQIDEGVVQGLVDNQGAIIADNGAVYLTSKGKDAISRSVVNHSGIIEANRLEKNAQGEIILLADMQTGTANVTGYLSAQGMNGQDGGFIETSGQVINIGETAKVTTLSEQGKTGEWLIDPYNVIISSAAANGTSNVSNTFTPSQDDSIVNVNTLQTALANNNITVTTAGAGTQDGNITVDAPITWNASTDLTLSAHNDIRINKSITALDANAGLNLQYGLAKVTTNNTANYYLKDGVKVNLQAGQNFSTQLGSDGSKINYTVITALGSAGSKTRTDLQGINDNLSGHYALGADIDASQTANTISAWGSVGFDPLGDFTTQFTGRFDGLGHSIQDLTINRPNESYVGLFGYARDARIQNTHLPGGLSNGKNQVGRLAGFVVDGSVFNVSATGNVSANYFSSSAGGLIGSSRGTVSNAYATGNVSVNSSSSSSYAGGLIGHAAGAVSNAYATGNVSANSSDSFSYAGGLIGSAEDSVSNAYATGNVSANSSSAASYAGGLIGSAEDSVSNAYATGNVSANSSSAASYAGGLIGRAEGSVSNAYATGNVSANNYSSFFVGGLIG